jgi:hypothetical protein
LKISEIERYIRDSLTVSVYTIYVKIRFKHSTRRFDTHEF